MNTIDAFSNLVDVRKRVFSFHEIEFPRIPRVYGPWAVMSKLHALRRPDLVHVEN